MRKTVLPDQKWDFVTELNDAAIAEIVRGLDPVDWVQVRLIAGLPPERRIVPGMRAQAFAMAA